MSVFTTGNKCMEQSPLTIFLFLKCKISNYKIICNINKNYLYRLLVSLLFNTKCIQIYKHFKAKQSQNTGMFL